MVCSRRGLRYRAADGYDDSSEEGRLARSLSKLEAKYYRIQIDSDGAISTEEVTVTDDELAAGETNDGRQIVASTANIGSLTPTFRAQPLECLLPRS